ncbi:hypothetical protein [Paraburkholderia youngii]|uniref:Uncharacterized protein n=1 Tax=Paraburkholderia youngii TaxID=2782701 RepID=A0A7Y6MXA5_9BURK|nr:hypothetical protein [Paraburkholderia youngii]NUX99536.1 hypothetical protein [Paraburkholderia youngii]
MESPTPHPVSKGIAKHQRYALPKLPINAVYQDEHGTRFRLLDVCRDDAWVIDLTNHNSSPTGRRYSVLLKQIDRRRLFVIETGVGNRTPTSPSSVARNRAAYETIHPLVVNPAIYDPEQRRRLVKKTAKETRLSKKTINDYLRRYWIGGQTEDALLPPFEAIDSSQHDLNDWCGRPLKVYDDGSKEYYSEKVRQMLVDRFPPLDEMRKQHTIPRGERPFTHEFRCIDQASIPLEHVFRNRKGTKAFDRDHNQHSPSTPHNLTAADHLHEIDATIANVRLAGTGPNKEIVGKPTMYSIFDSVSRLCVGFHIHFEG